MKDVWIVVAIAFLVSALLFAERTGRKGLRAFAKTGASLGFTFLALSRASLTSAFGTAITVGLCLSLLGDVCLLSDRKQTFMAGIVAFLLGHLAFTVGFFLRGVAFGPLEGTLLLALLVGGLVLRWLLPHAGSLKGAVLSYVLVISVMVPAAIACSVQTGRALIALGALAFYVSDLSVARDRFVVRSFSNKLWGLPLYYVGQVLLALCVP